MPCNGTPLAALAAAQAGGRGASSPCKAFRRPLITCTAGSLVGELCYSNTLKKQSHLHMGQKANPISLRLKTTNKSFDSCWYSYLHYSTLLSLDIKARSYLDKIFEQIRYPKPLVALTLMPKRGKVLMLYLNPERSRGERGERFQLRPLIPSRPLQRRAHPLPNGGLGVGVEPGQRQAPLVGTRLWGS